MTTLAVAAIAAATGLACYWLGVWMGRRTAAAVVEVVDLTEPLSSIVLIDQLNGVTRQRDKYRVAWLSARRRAANRNLLAQKELLRTLKTISGAVDDYAANRPTEDVIGEIGLAVDSAIARMRATP